MIKDLKDMRLGETKIIIAEKPTLKMNQIIEVQISVTQTIELRVVQIWGGNIFIMIPAKLAHLPRPLVAFKKWIGSIGR